MEKMIKFRVPTQLKVSALRYAREHGTSVSALLRQFLESLTAK